jgi:AcrR family transcriptional regulator
VSSPTPNRRARLRAEANAEIKAIALRLMADGGPDAISLRAIAREMGVTPAALYVYFRTRDDLITTLIVDVHTSLVDALEAARDGVPAADPAGRLVAWAEAFRAWALANPQGFRLIYGDPVPGYRVPEGGAAPEAEHRTCAGLTGLVAAGWPAAAQALEPDERYGWDDFAPHLVATTRADFPGLPPEALAVTLRLWGRLHGMVSLEVYGHLAGQTPDPAKVYRSEVRNLVVTLGLAG